MRCAKYVGRVGALALALGIGTAVAAPAAADTSTTESSTETAAVRPAKTPSKPQVGDRVSSPDPEPEPRDPEDVDSEDPRDAEDPEDSAEPATDDLVDLGDEVDDTDTGESADVAAVTVEPAGDSAEPPARHTPEAAIPETGPADSEQHANPPELGDPVDTVVPQDNPGASPVVRTLEAPAPVPSVRQPTGPVGLVLGAPRALADIATRALAMLFNPPPKAPGDPPLLLAVLAFVRREIQRTFFNTSPTATADTATTTQGVPIRIALLGNDTDPDAGDVLTVTGHTQPAHGVVTLNGDGTVTYTPTAGFNGVDTFSYTISDGASAWHGHGLFGVHTATATVTITVQPANGAPTAVDDSATTNEDTALTLTGAALVANDRDPRGGPLSIGSVGDAVNGRVTLNSDGSVTFTPNLNYHGAASFTYRVRDAGGTLSDNTATVGIVVTPVDDVVFEFSYGSGSQYWTPEAKAALQAAATRLAENIATSSQVVITYDVTADDIRSGYTAYAISPWGTWQPAGFWSTVVREKILSQGQLDANGAEADATLHFSFAWNWEYGDSVGWDEIDFQAIATHELLHTLGFVSNVSSAGLNTNRYWYTFDEFLVDRNGTPVVGADFAWNTAYDPHLSGGNGGLFFGGAHAVAAYGGLVPLQAGSLSHLDRATFTGAAAAYMGELGYGQTLRRLSAVEIGILEDLGYTVVPAGAAALVLV